MVQVVSTQPAASTALPTGDAGGQVEDFLPCPLQQVEEVADCGRGGICFNSLKDSAAGALL